MKKIAQSIMVALLILSVPTAVFAELGQTPTTYNQPSGSGVVGNGNLPPYIALEPIPGLNQSGQVPFGVLLDQLFKILIIIGQLVTVGAFVYAGIMYMMSDTMSGIENAKKRLWACVWGLLLLISSWLILYTINPQLVMFGGGLNPVAINYQLITSSGSENPCMGTSCLTQVQQAAIQDVRQNGTIGATPADIATAQEAAAKQFSSCAGSGGKPTLGGSVGGGCESPAVKQYMTGGNYTACNNIVGAQGQTGICVK